MGILKVRKKEARIPDQHVPVRPSFLNRRCWFVSCSYWFRHAHFSHALDRGRAAHLLQAAGLTRFAKRYSLEIRYAGSYEQPTSRDIAAGFTTPHSIAEIISDLQEQP